YIYRDKEKAPLYVGKSVDLRSRVSSYFHESANLPPKTSQMISKIDSVEVIHTESEIEALLLEAALIQSIKPEFNTALKDDKRYKYIQITDSQFSGTKKYPHKKISHRENAYPQLETARKIEKSDSIYFGPFPDSRTVQTVLKFIRKTFGWCGYTSMEQLEKSTKPCFYYHINQCPGICAGVISQSEYLEHIDAIIRFLDGKTKDVLKEIKENMLAASSNQDYEKANLYKNQLDRLAYVTQSFRNPESFLDDPVLKEEQFYFARQELRELLGDINQSLSSYLRNLERVEAYDISNTQGTNPTGSMVVLKQGHPENSHYRRFKIKDIPQANDFEMMAQIIRRRFKRLKFPEKNKDESFSEIPQLLVIDGGKGQVSSAMESLQELGLRVPIIGLAKKEEIIIVPRLDSEGYQEIILPKESAALKLLQRIRDEAHRFAKNYHVLLRRKKAFI
ncbi:excinuclease ABC subunit UvrC, partial [candidate division WWE3 bacterium]|nr:excinuclease ABC subunit UvrC [candidate division WWE3 bacterium]